MRRPLQGRRERLAPRQHGLRGGPGQPALPLQFLKARLGRPFASRGRATVAPIREMQCCAFTVTAISRSGRFGDARPLPSQRRRHRLLRHADAVVVPCPRAATAAPFLVPDAPVCGSRALLLRGQAEKRPRRDGQAEARARSARPRLAHGRRAPVRRDGAWARVRLSCPDGSRASPIHGIPPADARRRDRAERVTCDFDVSFTAAGGRRYAIRPGHIIVETKTLRSNGLADRLLCRHGARPLGSCSKYCLGVALAYPGVVDSRFRRLLRRHFSLPPAGEVVPA